MRRHITLSLALLLALVLVLLVAPSATAAVAPDQRAQFGATVRGQCLVDLPNGSGGREYVEVASGSLTVSGQGVVTGMGWFKDVPVYELDPATLRVGGLVSACWSHDGVSYSFRARLTSTADTDTFLGTAFDHIILGTSESPDWTTLSYSGTFTANGERTPVEGSCCVVAGPNMGIPTVTIKFIIAGYQPFGLVWAKESGIVDLWGPYPSPFPCPAADRFDYRAHVTEPQPTVLVGTSPDFPPFEYVQDGQVVGFDIDLVREVARRAGFRVQFQPAPFESLIPGLTTYPPAFDMVASSLTITPWREEIIDFSEPYYYAASDPSPYQYYGFGFPTGSPLRLRVNAALERIKADGTYAEIYVKWFGVEPVVIP